MRIISCMTTMAHLLVLLLLLLLLLLLMEVVMVMMVDSGSHKVLVLLMLVEQFLSTNDTGWREAINVIPLAEHHLSVADDRARVESTTTELLHGSLRKENVTSVSETRYLGSNVDYRAKVISSTR